MNVASKIPTGMIDGWSNLNKFIMTNVMPAASWSGGIFTAVANMFQTETGTGDSEAKKLAAKFGTSEETAALIEKLRMKYLSAEDMTAGNEDAKMCLRKPGADWRIFEDYAVYVRTIRDRETQRRAADSTAPKLRVRTYFAESDMMIGKTGRDYFNKTWRENGGEHIDYESYDLPGTNHDSAIGDPEKGAQKMILSAVSAARR